MYLYALATCTCTCKCKSLDSADAPSRLAASWPLQEPERLTYLAYSTVARIREAGVGEAELAQRHVRAVARKIVDVVDADAAVLAGRRRTLVYVRLALCTYNDGLKAFDIDPYLRLYAALQYTCMYMYMYM